MIRYPAVENINHGWKFIFDIWLNQGEFGGISNASKYYG
jgi:hypothetical protein